MNERYGCKAIRLIFLCYKLEIPKEKFQEREGHNFCKGAGGPGRQGGWGWARRGQWCKRWQAFQAP